MYLDTHPLPPEAAAAPLSIFDDSTFAGLAKEKMCCDSQTEPSAAPDSIEPKPTVIASLPPGITCSQCGRHLAQDRFTVSQLKKYRLRAHCVDCITVPEADSRTPALYEFMPPPEVPLPERSNFLEGKEDREAFLPAPLPSDAIAHDESIRIEALEKFRVAQLDDAELQPYILFK